MARFTRIQVALKMAETGIIPVFYNKDLAICKNVIKACYNGGVRVFEFTNRGDFAHEIFSELNKYAEKELPELMLGIGSVMDAGTTSLYIQLGTSFVVSPVLKEEMAVVCNRRKILWSPGCGSLSEISRAEELGAEVVKIFPAEQVGGPKFVTNIKAPCPWTNIMPTGGVEPTEEGLKIWIDAGAYCVGIGSKLITSEILKNQDWMLLKEKVKLLIAIYKKIKK